MLGVVPEYVGRGLGVVLDSTRQVDGAANLHVPLGPATDLRHSLCRGGGKVGQVNGGVLVFPWPSQPPPVSCVYSRSVIVFVYSPLAVTNVLPWVTMLCISYFPLHLT